MIPGGAVRGDRCRAAADIAPCTCHVERTCRSPRPPAWVRLSAAAAPPGRRERKSIEQPTLAGGVVSSRAASVALDLLHALLGLGDRSVDVAFEDRRPHH